MKTLIIYDDTGTIRMTQTGDINIPKSVGMVVVDVPNGYTVANINPETGEPVLEKAPPTLEERIAELEAVNAALLGEE